MLMTFLDLCPHTFVRYFAKAAHRLAGQRATGRLDGR